MKAGTSGHTSRRKGTVLVTGASSGIGYELCKLFGHDGYDLVIVARDRKRLAHIASAFHRDYGIDVHPIPCDLSETGAALALYQNIKRKKLSIEFLINNAGFGHYGSFMESAAGNEQAMIGVNITTLTHLTKLFLPGMVNRKSGKILNVASTAAFQPGPLMAVYYATKAYVLSFSEALAAETEGTGVTVSVLCPGPTHTQFQQRAGLGRNRAVPEKIFMNPAEVAKAGYRGLMKGKNLIVPGLSNKVSIQLHRFLPRNFMLSMIYKIQKQRIIHE